MKKSRHSEDDHEEVHNETWLISYADMMTLLFGLFVILYSIAMDNQGQMDQKLSEVSSALVKDNKPPPVKQPPPPENVEEIIKTKDKQLAEQLEQTEKVASEKTKADLQIVNMKLKNQELLDEVETLKKLQKNKELVVEDSKKEKKQELLAEILKADKKNSILLEELEALKRSKKEVELAAEITKAEKNELEKKIRTRREPATDDKAERKNRDLRAELEALKTEKKDLEKKMQARREPATDDKKAEKKNKELQEELDAVKTEKKDLEKKIAEIKVQATRETAAVDGKVEKLKELDKSVEEQKRANADLQKKIQQKDQQIEQTQKQLNELQEENKNTPKFLMFVLKWFTERHDLDLIVYDSKGKKFDFKKRDYTGYPGRLALDSRSGPGAEIWQTSEFSPGEYRLIVKFYQEYSNAENARFVIEVSSPKTTLATEQVEIKFSEKSKEFKFKVSAKGAVTLL